MAMGIKCCKDCKKRFLGCHDNCATYKAELEEMHKEKEYNKKHHDVTNYDANRIASADMRRSKKSGHNGQRRW